jgi:ribosomal protein L40E
LDAAGEEGLIYTDGNSELWLWDSEVDASIRATGSLVDIRNSDLMGSSIYIDTQQTTIIWDTTFTGVTTLQFVSDDSNPNTPDFDFRNITFNQLQTSQLRFIGDQYVIFTNVDTYVSPGKDWYDGMVMENARIARYWWLTVRNVDGIGNPIQSQLPDVSQITIERLEFDSITQTYNWVTEFSQNVPSGVKLWPALSEVRYAIPDPHSTEYTYHLEGYVTLLGVPYYPDEQKNVSVTDNMVVDLEYSVLTPDLWIEKIEFGGPGAAKRKPVDLTLYLNATIRNTGAVAASNVEVHFFATSLISIGTFSQDGYVSYLEAQSVIGQTIALRIEPLIPPNGNVTVSAIYTSTAITTNAPTISVFVDIYNKLAETDETNNEAEETFDQIFGWPDYWLQSIVTVPDSVAVNSPVEIKAALKNLGRGPGTGAVVTFSDNGSPIGTVNLADLAAGSEADAILIHNFATAGSHVIEASVAYSGGDITKMDYNPLNNRLNKTISTYTQADLTITNMELPPGEEVVVNSTFLLNVTVTNLGQAAAYDFNVSVYYDSISDTNQICVFEGLTLPHPITSLSTHTIQISCSNVPRMGSVTLHAFADSDSVVYETDETNNNATLVVDVHQANAEIVISSPLSGSTINAGSTVEILGYVNTTEDPILPIPDVTLTISLRESGTVVDSTTARTNQGGYFVAPMTIPDNLPDGSYEICAVDTAGSIPELCIQITLQAPPEEFPWWIIFLIIIIVIIIIVATIVYLRYRGLGKMVECGECGALIPEGSSKCPKCGVEFETDTVKCSSCGAWIPSDVKNCPDCGVEFVVGEVKAEDYQARMRKQYDQLVNKFREQARRDLGSDFTEDQFQGWWRAQPTYISFQQWLREEEEKKKMGSAPCPTCGTLNSVTAKICHRCGTPLKKVEQPEERAAPPARPPAAPPGPPGPPPSEEPAAPPPTTPVPKKVVKKPTVPKRVVIRKPGEPPKEEG